MKNFYTIYEKYLIYCILLGIFIIALILRFYQIDKIPVSLYWDEVSSTYNAYSIAHTGKDEFGTSFPLLFRAFEDYKASGNIYLTAIATKLFGLNEFSARFTSAFLGSITVLLTYFLTKELLYSKRKDDVNTNNIIAFLSALLLTISPWHVQFSRTGFEANVAVFFTVLGVVLFLRSVHSINQWLLYTAMFLFGFNFYVYRSVWIFLPLLLLVLFSMYRKQLFVGKMFRHTIISLLLFFSILAFFIPTMISEKGMVRARQVNIFNNSQQEVFDAVRKQTSDQTFIEKVIHNRRVVYTQILIKNYFSHFNPSYVFFTGDGNGRHGVSGMGILYLWEIPFIFLGLYGLWRYNKNALILVGSWILIAPLAAAVSVPSPHALRSLNMIPMPQILVAMGIVIGYRYFTNNKVKILYIALLSTLVLVFFLRYIYLYFIVTPYKVSGEWADGYKQLTEYVFVNEKKYDKVLISGHYWQPYIYFLFYKQYSPEEFQKNGSKKSFDKYVFGGTSWDKDVYSLELHNVDLQKHAQGKNVLVALSPGEYASQKNNITTLKNIYNHNKELVFIVGEVKK